MTPLRIVDFLPLEAAMPDLLPSSANKMFLRAAQEACEGIPLELQAGIWVYVDDLARAHEISQAISGPIGAYWHGIVHRREGDFSNARYWFRQAGPAIEAIADSLAVKHAHSEQTDWHPSVFVDQVAAARGANPSDLVETQRKEWMALFTYCMQRAEMEQQPK